MTPSEAGPPSTPRDPAEASAWLAAHGPRLWQAADGATLDAACRAVPDAELAAWPDVARWRALAALLEESADALPCLECAHEGHAAAGNAVAAAVDAHIALVQCTVDVGAMAEVETWVARSLALELPLPGESAERGTSGTSGPSGTSGADAFDRWWVQMGRAARAVVGDAHAAGAGLAIAWLHRHLQPLGPTLVPHERLLTAQVLVNAHFARQQHEQYDLIAAAVEAPGSADRAPSLSQARWRYTLGFAYYQVGRHAPAEAAWQQALAGARERGHGQAALMTSLALLRLLLDRGRLDDAAALESGVTPRFGAGRTTQLIELQQMRARLMLLRGQPVQAQAMLGEALALAAQVGLGEGELASCRTDEMQVLMALGRVEEAAQRLARLAQSGDPRNAAVFRVLLGLLQATREPVVNAPELATALAEARRIRYTMFFRLLPARAADVCAQALQQDIEVPFVTEIVRARGLSAPAGAGAEWPWPVWLRLLGGFELRLDGRLLPRPAKAPAKPLELLRLLGCEADLSLPLRHAADALWPEADGDAARKSLEMTVQRLRRLLGDPGLLSVHDGIVGLDTRRVGTDLQVRRRSIEQLQALAMQPAGDPATDAAACLDAVARLLSSGPGTLLPGAPDAPWLMARRRAASQERHFAVKAACAVLERAAARGVDIDGAGLQVLQALRAMPMT